ncbi:hypothetical protein ACGFIG_04260 [Micromonospora sp. NPDC049048]|uniref:hypothetical protein n=1 Tax=Micromonospora sp. NPDC049048 TaxID=3364263 RepID=UPI00370FE69D
MHNFEYVATTIAFRMPTVLVLLAGLVLAAAAGRRLTRGPRLLALFGLGVLLLGEVLSTAWIVLLPRVFTSDWGRSNFQLVNLANSGLLALAYALGLGLLIAALLAGRRPGGAAAGPFGGGAQAGPFGGGAQAGPLGGGAPVSNGWSTPATGPGWRPAGGADVPAQRDERSVPDAPTGTGTDQP